MRVVTKQFLGGLLLCVLALSPLTAHAQATLDPAVLATVQIAVSEVCQVAQPATSTSACTPADVSALIPSPPPDISVIAGPTAEPTEEPEDEPTPEPTEEPALEPLPPFDLATATVYESGAITLHAPPEWEVEDYSSDGDTDLYISLPGNADVFMALQDGGETFPGLMGLVIFPALADLLVRDLGEGGSVDLADVTTTAQGVPTARVLFQGDMDGQQGGGALYVLSGGDSAFMFIAFAPLDVWESLRPNVEAVASNIRLDPEAITLVTADSDDFYYVDDEGRVEVYVPNGWHVSGSTLEDLPVILTDPAYSYAMMMATQEQFLDTADPTIQGLLEIPVDEYTPEVIQELSAALLDEITSGGDFVIDETQNEVFDYGDGITLRFIGEGEIEEDAIMPVAVYFDQSSDGFSVALVMGDIDAMLADEVTTLDVVQSLISLE